MALLNVTHKQDVAQDKMWNENWNISWNVCIVIPGLFYNDRPVEFEDWTYTTLAHGVLSAYSSWYVCHTCTCM